MAYPAPCPACREGRHEDHRMSWGTFDPIKAGPFVCGGAVCPCRGQCPDPTGEYSGEFWWGPASDSPKFDLEEE